MEYRKLGRSGLKVSPLCLGTMMFGGPTDEPTSMRIIARARDAGVNFIDTADAYNQGRSEEIAGRGVAAERDKWVLATKLANAMGEGPNERGLSRKWVMQAADASLKRLGTDYLDIYYLHKEDHDAPLEETVRAMGDLVRLGKIRYFGVSNELSGLACGRDLQPLRSLRHRSPDRQPALLQRHEPHARNRASAGLRLLRLGRDRL